MKIALYDGILGSGYSHHALPFWHNPQQPKLLFNPEAMADFTNCNDSSIPLKGSYSWDVLMALHSMELPGIMAHVSLPVDMDAKQFGGQKRFWVQITTEPKELDSTTQIPLVVIDGKVQVNPIWAVDYNKVQGQPDVSSQQVWVEFFSNKIKEEQLKLGKELETLREEVKQKEELIALYPVLV